MFSPPFVGYSVDDAQEGDGADDADGLLLSRVAEMEATQRQSARSHRLRVLLAQKEKEVLEANMSRLRTALKNAQRDPHKVPRAAAEECSEKESQSPVNIDISGLGTLLNACDGAERVKRLATHINLLQCLERGRKGVAEKNRRTSVFSETWMPMSSVSNTNTTPRQSFSDTMRWFKGIQGALEKVKTELDPHMASVVTSLGNEIRRLCEKSDALSAVKSSLESQDRMLSSRWSEHVLWGTERSLVASEEQLSSNMSALHLSSTEKHLFGQQQQLQKRLHSAEVAVGTLMAAASGVSLPPVSPAVLQAAIRRHQELERLQDRLKREILYLRKLLQDKLVLLPLLVCNTELTSLAKVTANEGRSALLQQSCAALAQRLIQLTQEIVSEVIRGSSACTSSAEQDEELFVLETKAGTLHSSIVTFLTENCRLRQEIKDAALIKHMAVPGSAAIMLLAERLQTPFYCQHPAERSGGDDDEERNERGEGDAEESDVQKRLANIFTEHAEELMKVFTTHLRGVANLFKSEKLLCRDIAFLLRMMVAADRLLLGKVGVPLPANNSADDIARELDEAHVCFTPPQDTLRQLPSLDAICSALQSQSIRHESTLSTQCGAAAKTWKELRDDVEWCRQQCPKEAAVRLRGAEEELRELKASLPSAGGARERDTARLEAELARGKEQLARLQDEMCALQEELAAAEEQWRILQEEEEKGENEADLANRPVIVTAGSAGSNDSENDVDDGTDNKESDEGGV